MLLFQCAWAAATASTKAMSFRPPMSTQRTRPEWNAREERLRTKGREGSSALVADVGVVPQEAEAAQWCTVVGCKWVASATSAGRSATYSIEKDRTESRTKPSKPSSRRCIGESPPLLPGTFARPDGYVEAEAERVLLLRRLHGGLHI